MLLRNSLVKYTLDSNVSKVPPNTCTKMLILVLSIQQKKLEAERMVIFSKMYKKKVESIVIKDNDFRTRLIADDETGTITKIIKSAI